MGLRFEQYYRMKDGSTPLSELFFNPIFKDIDLRLGAQEDIQKDWESAIAVVTSSGLQRIDDALLPAFQKVQELASLGFLTAQSESSVTFQLGAQQLSVMAGPQRDIFTPTPFIVLTRSANTTDYAVAQTVDYDSTTGLLDFVIVTVAGNHGPWSDVWVGAMASGALITQSAINATAASASAAAASASGAAGSASGASASAIAAAASATSAASALASFLGSYRGALASAPSSPAVGNLWYDTTNHVMKVYDTTVGWAPVVTTSIGGVRSQDFTATAGQTVFTVDGGFTNIDVSINGFLLQQGTDYTVSSPTVTLTSGAALNDVVQVRGYLASASTDYYTKAQVDTLLTGKAALSHSHVVGDITGLQAALDAKAALSHSHVMSDIAGLSSALSGKANSTHSHAISDITGLQAALDAKAALSHTHSVATTGAAGFMSATDKSHLDTLWTWFTTTPPPGGGGGGDGSGTCLTPEAPILMADNTIRLLGDLRVGDLVMGADGRANRVTKAERVLLGSMRSLWTMAGIRFSGEHGLWSRVGGSEYWGVLDIGSYYRERREGISVPGEDAIPALKRDPFILTGNEEVGTLDGFQRFPMAIDRSATSATELVALATDGTHSMFANGVLVGAYIDDRDFDYDSFRLPDGFRS